ncbi:MAG TPA: type II toxin-antitoxin system CcdA family antitoxin [Caulobacteraceae bacterium]|jgi:antitoxin CcdA
MGKVELHLEIDAELLAQANEKGVVLDAALEAGIRAALTSDSSDAPIGIVAAVAHQRLRPAEAEAAAKRWAEENVEAIEAYRRRIDERGMFGEDLRRW